MSRPSFEDATLDTIRIAGKAVRDILADSQIELTVAAIQEELNRRKVKFGIQAPGSILAEGLFAVEFHIDRRVTRRVYSPELRTALGYALAMVIAEEKGLTRYFYPVNIPDPQKSSTLPKTGVRPVLSTGEVQF